ncbi:hypothetical protein MML48_9g00000123 [Holotrichia oblita]|uniref:Uncharacterized protein n=1 Tax=Holotrichia oblita TaxID=644536 RepID=A0ACB9SKL5_HOLOL|nr:hypothetical protein MML48_9g00000123 [Holotrichia oblita]
MQACTPLNAINGFKKTGIFPYDPDVFTNIDFAAAEVTEQNEPQNDNAHEENDAAYEPNEDVTDENNVAYEQNGEDWEFAPSKNTEMQENALPTIPQAIRVNRGKTSTSTNTTLYDRNPTPSTSKQLASISVGSISDSEDDQPISTLVTKWKSQITPKQVLLQKKEILAWLSEEEVKDLFELLKETLTKNDLINSPGSIYNMDETGIQLNNKPGNVIATKGSKDVHVLTASEKGETVSVRNGQTNASETEVGQLEEEATLEMETEENKDEQVPHGDCDSPEQLLEREEFSWGEQTVETTVLPDNFYENDENYIFEEINVLNNEATKITPSKYREEVMSVPNIPVASKQRRKQSAIKEEKKSVKNTRPKKDLKTEAKKISKQTKANSTAGTNPTNPLQKYCVLLFDEMSIKPNLRWNPVTGSVEGFEDFGYKQTDKIADHVQVYFTMIV